MQYIAVFLITGIVFAIIDAIWLKATANFYKKQFGGMLRAAPNFTAATAFYLLYVGGIVLFVLLPLTEAGTFWQVGLRGALFGMVAYATYDLTNFATLKNWPVRVTFIDISWGMVATGGASAISFFIVKDWLF